MIWVILLIAALIATPLTIEHNRRHMTSSERGAAPGSFATLSQGVTHYQWLGPARGPVAVCVHGLTTPSFVWRGLARGLALMGFRVLTYDIYGRGFSDRVKGPQTKAFFLRQLNDLLAHEKIEDGITLIGYSMGGAIATSFAAEDSYRIRRMILLAPAGVEIARHKLIEFMVRTPIIGDWMMLAFYPSILRMGFKAERQLPSSVKDITKLMDNELNWRGYVPAVLSSMRGFLQQDCKAEHQALHREELPTLAIWGAEDPVIPLSALGTSAQWNRTMHQEVVEGAGHGLPYTHTDQVLATIGDFVGDDP
ncbi:MAG: alpha/beta hydrolase [Sulfitobacter sp.]